MKSQKRGNGTSKVEIAGISSKGFRLSVNAKNFFLSYKDFPWFKKANASQIHDVAFHSNHRLHWNKLDIDLELESLQNKGKYNLIYR